MELQEHCRDNPTQYVQTLDGKRAIVDVDEVYGNNDDVSVRIKFHWLMPITIERKLGNDLPSR